MPAPLSPRHGLEGVLPAAWRVAGRRRAVCFCMAKSDRAWKRQTLSRVTLVLGRWQGVRARRARPGRARGGRQETRAAAAVRRGPAPAAATAGAFRHRASDASQRFAGPDAEALAHGFMWMFGCSRRAGRRSGRPSGRRRPGRRPRLGCCHSWLPLAVIHRGPYTEHGGVRRNDSTPSSSPRVGASS